MVEYGPVVYGSALGGGSPSEKEGTVYGPGMGYSPPPEKSVESGGSGESHPLGLDGHLMAISQNSDPLGLDGHLKALSDAAHEKPSFQESKPSSFTDSKSDMNKDENKADPVRKLAQDYKKALATAQTKIDQAVEKLFASTPVSPGQTGTIVQGRPAKAPLGFIKGLAESPVTLAATPLATYQLIKNPVGTIKQTVKFAEEHPMYFLGNLLGTALLGEAIRPVFEGPLKTTYYGLQKLSSNYVPPEETGINWVESYTYDPQHYTHYLRFTTGEEQTLIHMTDHPAFDLKTGQRIKLIGSPDENVAPWRRAIDARHFYVSLPTDEGKPNAYLAYVGIGSGEEAETRLTLLPRRVKAVIIKHEVNFEPPEPGENILEYQARVATKSGNVHIPAENVFDINRERQAVIPAEFEGVSGTKYPGTWLVKKGEEGFTIYETNTQPDFIKDTAVGKALYKLGYGRRFAKIHLEEWEPEPVEEMPEVPEVQQAEIPELNLEKYYEDYGAEHVSILEEALKRAMIPFSSKSSSHSRARSEPRSKSMYSSEVSKPFEFSPELGYSSLHSSLHSEQSEPFTLSGIPEISSGISISRFSSSPPKPSTSTTFSYVVPYSSSGSTGQFYVPIRSGKRSSKPIPKLKLEQNRRTIKLRIGKLIDWQKNTWGDPFNLPFSPKISFSLEVL